MPNESSRWQSSNFKHYGRHVSAEAVSKRKITNAGGNNQRIIA